MSFSIFAGRLRLSEDCHAVGLAKADRQVHSACCTASFDSAGQLRDELLYFRWPSEAERRMSRRSPAAAGRTGTKVHCAWRRASTRQASSFESKASYSCFARLYHGKESKPQNDETHLPTSTFFAASSTPTTSTLAERRISELAYPGLDSPLVKVDPQSALTVQAALGKVLT